MWGIQEYCLQRGIQLPRKNETGQAQGHIARSTRGSGTGPSLCQLHNAHLTEKRCVQPDSYLTLRFSNFTALTTYYSPRRCLSHINPGPEVQRSTPSMRLLAMRRTINYIFPFDMLRVKLEALSFMAMFLCS
jgi:hypothetical protein